MKNVEHTHTHTKQLKSDFEYNLIYYFYIAELIKCIAVSTYNEKTFNILNNYRIKKIERIVALKSLIYL